MAGHGRKNCDEALTLALAAGASIAAAAQQAQCSESTVRRRLADAGFRARVHEQRSEMIAAAIGRLATMGVDAADELHRLLQNGKDDNVKLGAVRAIFTHMLAGHEHEVLVQQLDELRSKIEELERASRHDPQRDTTPAGADCTEDGHGAAGPQPSAG
jgi:hypothetical protein